MSKPQFAILRFAKYKGPEISNIESHNERTKENYVSNPDIDKSRSHLNFHLITPEQKYRAEAERQIKEVGCCTRSDSVRVVEALVTATPEFFKGKKKDEIKAYFQEALNFIREHQDPKTITFPVTYDGESGALFVRTYEQQVETVVLLSRETNPLTVEVRMEVESGEVKEHPTYKRIQEYVQEKYGFKVHTAYIAEVKRMVGLDMHKAPNAVEQRKHEYHPCPPEKVEAIKDALRHFGLIAE